MPHSVPLTVPEFDFGTTPIRISVWHRRDGRTVKQGSRVVEIVVGDVVVDLCSPAEGVLRQSSAEDDLVSVGQVIGRVEVGERRAP